MLPHLLRNWIFYRNPIFPFADDLFPHTYPRQADTPFVMRYLRLGDSAISRGPILERLENAARIAFTRSFRRPSEAGSVFVVLLPLLVFLSRSRRLWLGAFVAVGALMTWGMSYANERYAQAIIPMLASVTAAIVVRAWQLGLFARVGLVALLGLQVVWGGDILVNQSFSGIDDALSLLRSGMKGHAKTRFDGHLASQRALDRTLPKDAVVLFHNTRLALGLNRGVLQDLPGNQGLISYRDITTPRQMCELYRNLGITHIVHEPGLWPAWTKQEEAIFAALLKRFASNPRREGEYEVFELPATLPPVEAPYRVLSLGTPGYPDGVYRVEAMGIYDPMPDNVKYYGTPAIPTTMDAAAAPEIIDHVNVVFVSTRVTLPEPLAAALRDRFAFGVAYRDGFSTYVRLDSPSP
jgi:hypothetical protein